MTTLNLLAKINYLPTFFGNWNFDIVPTLDNMVVKGIDENDIPMNSCLHVKKEFA
jgi:hypothetical protein